MKITCRKRLNDWVAHIEGSPGIWQAGKTEFEAIGNLMILLPSFGYDVYITLINGPIVSNIRPTGYDPTL